MNIDSVPTITVDYNKIKSLRWCVPWWLFLAYLDIESIWSYQTEFLKVTSIVLRYLSNWALRNRSVFTYKWLIYLSVTMSHLPHYHYDSNSLSVTAFYFFSMYYLYITCEYWQLIKPIRKPLNNLLNLYKSSIRKLLVVISYIDICIANIEGSCILSF